MKHFTIFRTLQGHEIVIPLEDIFLINRKPTELDFCAVKLLSYEFGWAVDHATYCRLEQEMYELNNNRG